MRDPARLAVAVVGCAEMFIAMVDDRATPTDVSVGCHDEVLNAVQQANAVACLDARFEAASGDDWWTDRVAGADAWRLR